MYAERKTILLTGASGGLGGALAKALQRDFNLALVVNKGNISVSESDTCKQYRFDLTDRQAAEKLVNSVVNDFGTVHILINNAGISNNAISWKMTDEVWEQVMELNLYAPFRLTRACLAPMRKQAWGRIINISSVVAHTGFPGTAAYAASKAGLEGLTKTLAKELIQGNFAVNAIALGYFEEGMIHTVPLALQQEIKQQIPLGRFGKVSELEACVRYLISDDTVYLTGQTLHLNGALRQ